MKDFIVYALVITLVTINCVYGSDVNDTTTSIETTDAIDDTSSENFTTSTVNWLSTSTIENNDVTELNDDDSDKGNNDDDKIVENPNRLKCKDGLLLSVWRPLENITFGDRFGRGLFYFLVMCYLFLGVSIVSDKFMAAIEKITAIEKTVSVRKPDGTKQKVVVRVWNETVANLTLMALGTSAPEILLSAIEIFSHHFQAGDLGPGTIVGSAAYNLFTIIAICIIVIPKNQVRRIKHLRVFFVTAAWSIFAYIWLYLILAYFSPGIVTVTEGVITFMGFPVIVYMAYVADRRLLIYKYLNKSYRMNKRGIMVAAESTTENTDINGRSNSLKLEDGTDLLPQDYKDVEQLKKDYLLILKELRREYPQYDRDTLEMMAQEQLLNSAPKSRAFYRIQATRKMLGGGNIIRKIAERTTNEVKADIAPVEIVEDFSIPKIVFDPSHYTVMENCGAVDVRILRLGDFSGHVSCDYRTEDGSAEAGSDYIAQSGTITFTPGISERFIKIDIIDDDVFEQDEAFYIQLSNPTNGAILGAARICTVMILDDDHSGFFAFATTNHELIETCGIFELSVIRSSGARGKVCLPYWTEDGTAKSGKAYEPIKEHLIFENNETE